MLFLAVEANSYRANMLQLNELTAQLEKPKPAPEHNIFWLAVICLLATSQLASC